MSPRFYFSLWFLFAAASIGTWVSGLMTMFALVVFGFLAFGLTFLGMMCVLPSAVAHTHEKPAAAPKEPGREQQANREPKVHGLATLKSA
jgi:hypothetical protein